MVRCSFKLNLCHDSQKVCPTEEVAQPDASLSQIKPTSKNCAKSKTTITDGSFAVVMLMLIKMVMGAVMMVILVIVAL